MACLTELPIEPSPEDGRTSDGSVRVLDVWHNCVVARPVEETGEVHYLHRKGAAPADQGVVVIPGSRGHYSYLVAPTDSRDALERSGYSLAHGAGLLDSFFITIFQVERAPMEPKPSTPSWTDVP